MLNTCLGSHVVTKGARIRLLRYLLYCTTVMLILTATGGCQATKEKDKNNAAIEPMVLNRTISSVANLHQSRIIPVSGWGIVAGLNGTGSSECPPALRKKLIKHIQQETGNTGNISAGDFLDSKDTAIVEIYGTIPAIAIAGEHFDLKINALPNTQTRSLSGGTLFATELKERSRIRAYEQYANTLAEAQGPVYISKPVTDGSDIRDGYILGGGTVTKPVRISLVLLEPNFHVASAIRNQLNSRFENNTAHALSASEIQIRIPPRYRNARGRFIEMLGQSFLVSNPELEQERISMLVGKIRTEENKLSPELALEAIGKTALHKLSPLLKSDNDAVRFHASRCMLAIGDETAVAKLQKFTKDTKSPYRVEAIEAIGRTASRSTVSRSLRGLLNDSDFEVRFAAYDQLVSMKDVSVKRSLIAGDFFLDRIAGTGEKIIYISQSMAPKIVLFGEPIRCEKNIFIKSSDGQVTINATAGSKTISVMRKHPNRPKLIGPILCSFRLKDLVSTLGEPPMVSEGSRKWPGLGLSYNEILSLLKQMCETGTIKAKLIEGPFPITEPAKTNAERSLRLRSGQASSNQKDGTANER